MYVVDNHGWFIPYRPHPEGAADCVVPLTSVKGIGRVGTVGADETVRSWFS